jgi:hypothetical protein
MGARMIRGLQIFFNSVVLDAQVSEKDGQGQATTAAADDEDGYFNGFHGAF